MDGSTLLSLINCPAQNNSNKSLQISLENRSKNEGHVVSDFSQRNPLLRRLKFFAVGCGLRLLRPAQFPLKERTWIVIRSASQRPHRNSCYVRCQVFIGNNMFFYIKSSIAIRERLSFLLYVSTRMGHFGETSLFDFSWFFFRVSSSHRN